MIVLEINCPQLSKPEATAARNENSIGDRMEKKPWEKPGSVGGPVPLRPDESVVCSNLQRLLCFFSKGHRVYTGRNTLPYGNVAPGGNPGTLTATAKSLLG